MYNFADLICILLTTANLRQISFTLYAANTPAHRRFITVSKIKISDRLLYIYATEYLP
jgi:hypothetical protein